MCGCNLLKFPGIWLIILMLISVSSCPCTNSFGDCIERANYNWLSCSIVFFSSLARFMYVYLLSIFFSFPLLSVRSAKSTVRLVVFFIFCCWLSLGLDVWSRWSDPFLSQDIREFCASHFPGRILVRAYTTFSYGYIKTPTIRPPASHHENYPM